MELTSTLQTEQYVKKELAKKLGQLQEKLGELKETVTLPPLGRAQSVALASGEGGIWARLSWVPGPGQRQLQPRDRGPQSSSEPVTACCPLPLTFIFIF